MRSLVEDEWEMSDGFPGNDPLIFNLGERTGGFSKRWRTFGGRPAFIVKNDIDRRFMKAFQALE
jgi:hypothetical protein